MDGPGLHAPFAESRQPIQATRVLCRFEDRQLNLDHPRPRASAIDSRTQQCRVDVLRRLNAGVIRSVPSRVYSGLHGGPTSMTQLRDIVHSDPEILGGTPVFVGTRVPIQSLFDYLEGGETVDEFLRQFPSVRRDQAIAALDFARATLLAGARPS